MATTETPLPARTVTGEVVETSVVDAAVVETISLVDIMTVVLPGVVGTVVKGGSLVRGVM